jgi:hypothetical protein
MAEPQGAVAPASTLQSIFDNSASEAPKKDASAEPEKVEEKKQPEGAPADQKKSDDKKGEPDKDSSPPASDSKKSADDKKQPDDKKDAGKEKDDKSKEKKDDKKDDKKEDQQKKDDSSKWETEDNPFVKRFKDTHAWGNQEHQKSLQLASQNQQLARENEILKKKAEGKWTEEDEKANEVTPEQIAQASLNAGKALASRNAAYQIVGKEKTDAVLTEFYQIFGEDSTIQDVVMRSESPVLEAFNIMNRYHFEQKYGDNPKAIFDAIEKEVKEKYRKELRDEITQELMSAADKKKKNPEGLSSGKGDNGVDAGKSVEKSHTPLKQIFG